MSAISRKLTIGDRVVVTECENSYLTAKKYVRNVYDARAGKYIVQIVTESGRFDSFTEAHDHLIDLECREMYRE